MKGFLYWNQVPKGAEFVIGRVEVFPNATLGILMVGCRYKDVAEEWVKKIGVYSYALEIDSQWKVYSKGEWECLYRKVEGYHKDG